MNNKEYIARLAAETGYPADDTQKLVQAVLQTMGKRLEKGDTVQLHAFGIFDVKKRLERVITNPSTGQKMLVPPKLVVNYKPAVNLRDHFKKGGEE